MKNHTIVCDGRTLLHLFGAPSHHVLPTYTALAGLVPCEGQCPCDFMEPKFWGSSLMPSSRMPTHCILAAMLPARLCLAGRQTAHWHSSSTMLTALATAGVCCRVAPARVGSMKHS
jgi:hypothetical protein